MDQLFRYRIQIVEKLDELHREYLQLYADSPWSKDTLERISNSAVKGKLLRGALVLFAAEQYRRKIDNDVLTVAALMELAHTGLLIHDDIMDGDEMRRGEKSIYTQFADKAQELDVADPLQVGKGMGICAGDIIFFMVFQSIARLDVPAKLTEIFTKELMRCAFGQMQDIASAHVTTDDILSLYKNKTGRYSFSLPLLLGAVLASVNDSEMEKMIRFGETIGPLFQIADDRLGITGTIEEIGKPVGSDIKEGKNTLLWHLLNASVSDEERLWLDGLIGQTPADDSLEKVKKLIEKYSINYEISKIEIALEKDARATIQEFEIADVGKDTLSELVDFVSKRKH